MRLGRPEMQEPPCDTGLVTDEPPLPTLRGRDVVLRPLRPGDVPRVAEIQAEPAVARWWGPPDEAELLDKAEGRDESKAFAVERAGELVGLVQFHEENEPDFRHAGIDVFLSENAHGQGLGRALPVLLHQLEVQPQGGERVADLVDEPARDRPQELESARRGGGLTRSGHGGESLIEGQ